MAWGLSTGWHALERGSGPICSFAGLFRDGSGGRVQQVAMETRANKHFLPSKACWGACGNDLICPPNPTPKARLKVGGPGLFVLGPDPWKRLGLGVQGCSCCSLSVGGRNKEREGKGEGREKRGEERGERKGSR